MFRTHHDVTRWRPCNEEQAGSTPVGSLALVRYGLDGSVQAAVESRHCDWSQFDETVLLLLAAYGPCARRHAVQPGWRPVGPAARVARRLAGRNRAAALAQSLPGGSRPRESQINGNNGSYTNTDDHGDSHDPAQHGPRSPESAGSAETPPHSPGRSRGWGTPPDYAALDLDLERLERQRIERQEAHARRMATQQEERRRRQEAARAREAAQRAAAEARRGSRVAEHFEQAYGDLRRSRDASRAAATANYHRALAEIENMYNRSLTALDAVRISQTDALPGMAPPPGSPPSRQRPTGSDDAPREPTAGGVESQERGGALPADGRPAGPPSPAPPLAAACSIPDWQDSETSGMQIAVVCAFALLVYCHYGLGGMRAMVTYFALVLFGGLAYGGGRTAVVTIHPVIEELAAGGTPVPAWVLKTGLSLYEAAYHKQLWVVPAHAILGLLPRPIACLAHMLYNATTTGPALSAGANRGHQRTNQGPPRHQMGKSGNMNPGGRGGRNKGGKGPSPPKGTQASDKPDPVAADPVEHSEESPPVCERFKRGECRRHTCKFLHVTADGVEDQRQKTDLAELASFVPDWLDENLVPVVHGGRALLNLGGGRIVLGRLTGHTRLVRIEGSHILDDDGGSDEGKGDSQPTRVVLHRGTFPHDTYGSRDLWCVDAGVTLPHVLDNRYGTMVLRPSGFTDGRHGIGTAQSAFAEVSLPHDSYGSAYFEPFQGTVMVTLLKVLNSKFKCGNPDQRLIQQAVTYACSLFSGELPDVWPDIDALINDTVTYFYRSCIARGRNVTVLRNGLIRGPPAGAEIVSEEHLGLHVHPDVIGTGAPWFEPPLPPSAVPYELNDVCHFRIIKGCQWSFPAVGHFKGLKGYDNMAALEGIGVPVKDANLPVFHTFGDSGRDMTIWRAAQIRSTGANQRTAPDSTLALYSGLQRQVKKRQDAALGPDADVVLRAAQENLDRLGVSYPSYRNSVAACGFATALQRLRAHREADLLACGPGPALMRRARTPREVDPLDRRALPRGATASQAEWDSYVDRANKTISTMVAFVDKTFARSRLEQLMDGIGTCAVKFGHALAWPFFEFQKWKYGGFMGSTKIETLQEQRERWANLPDPKKAERLRLVQGVWTHDQDGLVVQNGFVKIKKEVNKPGKAARLFTPYKEGAILRPWLAGEAKALLEGLHTFEIEGMTVTVYCALHPDPEVKASVFKMALAAREQPYDNIFIAIHSDDSLISGVVDHVPFTYNADISSCDGSHHEVIFQLLHQAYAHLDEAGATALVRQSALPFLVCNPAEPGEAFLVSPHGKNRPFLGSGSANTTIINTLAVVMCGVSAARTLRTVTHKATPSILEGLRQGFAEVGYSATFGSCEVRGEFVPERMEFLKTFWCPETESVIMMPSAYLRGLGSRRTTITPASFGWDTAQFTAACQRPETLLHRAASQVVNGLCHEEPHAILKALEDRFNDKAAPPTDRAGELAEPAAGVRRGVDTTRALCRRYDLGMAELDSLINLIMTIHAGCAVTDSAYSKMLELDYGVPAVGEAALLPRYVGASMRRDGVPVRAAGC